MPNRKLSMRQRIDAVEHVCLVRFCVLTWRVRRLTQSSLLSGVAVVLSGIDAKQQGCRHIVEVLVMHCACLSTGVFCREQAARPMSFSGSTSVLHTRPSGVR